MRSTELVPKLADEFGIPIDLALKIDRSLANAGYRKKGSGRAVPEMSGTECIYFMLAVMTCDRASDVPEAMRYWVSASGVVSSNKVDVEAFRRLRRMEKITDQIAGRIKEDSKIELEKIEEFVEASNNHYSNKNNSFTTKKEHNIIDLEKIEGNEINLVDYLLFISRRMNSDPSNFLIDLNTKEYTAIIRFEEGSIYDAQIFECKEKPKNYSANDNSKSVIVRVTGEWLKFIADHTEPEELKLD